MKSSSTTQLFTIIRPLQWRWSSILLFFALSLMFWFYNAMKAKPDIQIGLLDAYYRNWEGMEVLAKSVKIPEHYKSNPSGFEELLQSLEGKHTNIEFLEGTFFLTEDELHKKYRRLEKAGVISISSRNLGEIYNGYDYVASIWVKREYQSHVVKSPSLLQEARSIPASLYKSVSRKISTNLSSTSPPKIIPCTLTPLYIKTVHVTRYSDELFVLQASINPNIYNIAAGLYQEQFFRMVQNPEKADQVSLGNDAYYHWVAEQRSKGQVVLSFGIGVNEFSSQLFAFQATELEVYLRGFIGRPVTFLFPDSYMAMHPNLFQHLFTGLESEGLLTKSSSVQFSSEETLYSTSVYTKKGLKFFHRATKEISRGDKETLEELFLPKPQHYARLNQTFNKGVEEQYGEAFPLELAVWESAPLQVANIYIPVKRSQDWMEVSISLEKDPGVWNELDVMGIKLTTSLLEWYKLGLASLIMEDEHLKTNTP